MRRLFAVAAAMILAGGFAGAAPVLAKKLPLVTVQAQPLEKLEADVTVFVEMIGGKDAAEKFKTYMKKDWAIFVAVSGLDQKKPILGYGVADGDFEKSSGALMIPVANETLFLDFLPKIPEGNTFKVEKVAGNAGLYDVSRANGDFPVRVLLRFANGYAYFGINVQPKDMDAEKLVAPADVLNPKETALVALRLNPESLPADTRKDLIGKFDKAFGDITAMMQGPATDKTTGALVEGYGKFLQKLVAQALNETESAALELVADPKSGELGLEIKAVPRKGSAAAKEIAARKPEPNRLGGFMTEDLAAGYFQSSFGQKELRDTMTAVYAEMKKKLNDDPPPEVLRPLAEELIDLLVRSQKAGKADYSAAAYGPDKKNQFHFAAVITCDDPSKLEKILRDLHANDAPDEIKKEIKFDVAKVGKISIHEVQVLNLPNVPPQVPKGTACVAFAPDAIFVTHGPESLEFMKKLLVAKPAEGRIFDAPLNPAKFVKLLAEFDPNIGGQAEQILGKDDKVLSALHFDVTGGETLRIRIGMHASILPKLIMFMGVKQQGN